MYLDNWIIGVGITAILVLLLLALRLFRRASQHDELDRVLLYWTPKDGLSVRDLLAGGAIIFGRTSSGKTSSAGRHIGRALVRDRNTYGLILAAKPEDLSMWQELFRSEGQSHRLLVFDGADSALRFNFLEEAGRRGNDTRAITQCITTIGETLRSGSRQSSTDTEAFFATQTERAIHNAVEILKHARGKVTASDLQQFITTSAVCKPHLLADCLWRSESDHCQWLQAAYESPKGPQAQHDVQQAVDFWCGESPNWSGRMGSSILAGVYSILFVFNSGLVHERVSTTSNFTFEGMQRNRQWLLVNFPPSVYGDNGLFIGTGFKYLMQRFVLRQHARRGDPINICWCDEAATWWNTFDAEYNSQSRSHFGTTVFLTQSIESFYAGMKGDAAKEHTLALLSNFSHRIIHALGSIETAEWASRTLGLRLEMHVGGSMQPVESVFDALMGNSAFAGSFSTQYEPVLQPGVFLTGLRRMGGPRNGFICDAILIRPGRAFSNGENWLRVSFSQR
ncbi:MAG TPA: hypothetical protein VGN12_06050 [Pirellulales bacterium]|jgi:hypothetical protein